MVNVHRSSKRISDGEVIETERQVDNNLYEQMLQQADPYRATIKKRRQSFIWKGQFFQLDTFHAPVNDLVMMESKGITEQETVNFPPFVKVLEDVTGKSDYMNYNIALRRSYCPAYLRKKQRKKFFNSKIIPIFAISLRLKMYNLNN